MKTISALLLTMFVAGCTSIQSVSLTPIPANRSKTVRAQASKTVFLGFNFDNDYIDPLVDDLKRQCPQGVISGILTKDELTSYVLVFTRTVTATGFCSGNVAKADGRRRSTASDDPLAAEEN